MLKIHVLRIFESEFLTRHFLINSYVLCKYCQEKMGTFDRKLVSGKELWPNGGTLVLLARDSIYAIARYMPSPVRLSVRLSVRHTGGSVKDG